MDFNFFKKKYILYTCGLFLFIIVTKILSTIDVYYTEKIKTTNPDGTSSFKINKISHKLLSSNNKHIVDINGEKFCVYVYPGYKRKKKKGTIVILPGYSYFDYKNNRKKYSPHDDFKKLIDHLSDKYRVVVIEYYGYSKSDNTDRKRSAGEICHEINYTMHLLGIKKYILMPHSISGFYAMQYINTYPEEVEGLIGIDITLPYYFLEEYESNEKFLEHKFNDDGRKIPEAYKNMYTYFWETAKSLEDFKLPETLPVTLFTSTQLIKYIDKEIADGTLKTRVEDYLYDMITNDKIQHINILEGTHYLHDTQSKTMAEKIKEKFL